MKKRSNSLFDLLNSPITNIIESKPSSTNNFHHFNTNMHQGALKKHNLLLEKLI